MKYIFRHGKLRNQNEILVDRPYAEFYRVARAGGSQPLFPLRVMVPASFR